MKKGEYMSEDIVESLSVAKQYNIVYEGDGNNVY